MEIDQVSTIIHPLFSTNLKDYRLFPSFIKITLFLLDKNNNNNYYYLP